MDRSRDLPAGATVAATEATSLVTAVTARGRGVRTEPRWKGAKPPEVWSRQKAEAVRAKHAWKRAAGGAPKPYDCTLGPSYVERVAAGTLYPYPLAQRAYDRTKLPPTAQWRLTSRHVELLAHVVTAHVVVKSQGFIASHDELATLLGCSARTAGARMRELASWGLVAVLPGFLPGGLVSWRAKNVYRVTAFAIALFAIGQRGKGAWSAPARERNAGAQLAGKNCQTELTGASLRIRKGADRQAVGDRRSVRDSDAGATPAPSTSSVKARPVAVAEASDEADRELPATTTTPSGPRTKAQAHVEQRLEALLEDQRAAEAAAHQAALERRAREATAPITPAPAPTGELELGPDAAAPIAAASRPRVDPATLPTTEELRRDGSTEADRARWRRIDEESRRRRENGRVGRLDHVAESELADVIESALRSHARGAQIRPVDWGILRRLRRASDLTPPQSGGDRGDDGGDGDGNGGAS